MIQQTIERSPIGRALTLEEICHIAKENAGLIEVLAGSAPARAWADTDLATIGARVLLSDPQIYDAIIATGYGCSREEAASLPLLKKSFLAVDVINRTRDQFAGVALWPIVRDHLAKAVGPANKTRH